MQAMRFVKMHGAGNDYVYVECFTQTPPRDPVALSKIVSDRHFGIGSDGLILILPSEKADARMRMFNADGSEAEMCGNGIRCVAKLVHDHGLVRKPRLTIETGRGILTLDLEIEKEKVQRVCVDMGEPILEAAKIPTTLTSERVIDYPVHARGTDPGHAWFQECGFDPHITCVSMGNPHCVVYCPNVRSVPLSTVGPVMEHWKLFPQRINVHFVQVHSPTEVTMRTWERGSGITLACGTGACAVCVAGVLTGRTQRKITAHLPGGDLELHWNEQDRRVYMTGPATEVFRGEWPEAV
jgi:diaminopimelate epimerase